MVDRIHHINFLVKDLDTAVERYKALLGDVELHYGDLEGRGVRTARFRLGESWLVLVQPTTTDSVPARHLAKHGEGFFLLSLGVASLTDAIDEVSARGGRFTGDKPRQGLDDWLVSDLDDQQFFGAQLQLCESAK
ncbi:MAG: methylmalonyl-CoA/ethylmalonyl-CoA epimerase [Polaribacter sp.]|jgi:methylmalonyl-CoA/ethylmalonyl-CoA epimerase